jgi:hypothetical protein
MPPVIGTAITSDWSFSGSLLTCLFPLGLFIVIATTLYLQFSRPHTVPGLRPLTPARATAPAAAEQARREAAGHGEDAAPAAPDPQASGSRPDGQRATGAGDDHRQAPGAAG